MATSDSRRWPRLASAAIVGGILAAALLFLTGAGVVPRAQAAPVPAPQAACPQDDPRPVSRTTTAFARVDGIPGDSAAVGHAGEIDVTSVRAALLAGSPTGGGPALCGASGGRPTINPIVLEKGVDRASVPLAGRALTGAHIATVRIAVFTGGAQPIRTMTYDLRDVTVLSVRQLQRGDSLTEEISLGFGRIAYEFIPTRPDGAPGASITFCFDIARNATC